MFQQLERDGRIAAFDAGAERRRPGRVEYTNPHLLKLLRAKPPAVRSDAVYASEREADSLAAARGIGASAISGAMGWGGFLMGLWFLLHR
jgi:hypothetical protein